MTAQPLTGWQPTRCPNCAQRWRDKRPKQVFRWRPLVGFQGSVEIETLCPRCKHPVVVTLHAIPSPPAVEGP